MYHHHLNLSHENNPLMGHGRSTDVATTRLPPPRVFGAINGAPFNSFLLLMTSALNMLATCPAPTGSPAKRL